MSKKCRDVLYINSPFESVRRGRKPKTMCLIWRTPRSLQTEIRQHTTTTTRLDMKLSHIANLVSRTVFFLEFRNTKTVVMRWYREVISTFLRNQQKKEE